MSQEDVEKSVPEDHVQISMENSNDAQIQSFSEAEQEAIYWRIDRRLVPTLALLYSASLLDRTNIGFAAIAGMSEALHLVGSRYNVITLIFFFPYVLSQPLAIVVLRKIGPRTFLSTIALLWGATEIGFGFTPSWTTMVGLRVILAALEAGFFPGCAYLMSCWYPRYQLQKRFAGFFVIGAIVAGFSSILAYGLIKMQGLADRAGWRWIFIVEGAATCAGAIAAYLFIVDFPELASRKSWRFLSDREASFVVAVIEKDRADAIPEPFHVSKYLKNALDLKVWGFASIFMLTTTNSYAIAYFLPIILNDGLGFSVEKSQLLVAPPYLASALFMFIEGIYSDKLRLRGPFVAFNAVLGLIGLLIMGFASNSGVRYFGVFLATISAVSNNPAVLTYQANNIRGQWKRALSSAAVVGMGGLGGIIGSTVFRTQDSPNYRPGIEACLIADGLIIVIVGLLTIKFWRANKRADSGGKLIEGQVGFRYTL